MWLTVVYLVACVCLIVVLCVCVFVYSRCVILVQYVPPDPEPAARAALVSGCVCLFVHVFVPDGRVVDAPSFTPLLQPPPPPPAHPWPMPPLPPSP